MQRVYYQHTMSDMLLMVAHYCDVAWTQTVSEDVGVAVARTAKEPGNLLALDGLIPELPRGKSRDACHA